MKQRRGPARLGTSQLHELLLTFPSLLMLVVLPIGHGLNMAINVLGTFVHTSRLQYLEFFSKFYEDGGTAFEPAVPCDKFSTAEAETSEEPSKERSEAG